MIDRSTNIKAALRSRQRGFLLNPYRFGSSSPPLPGSVVYLNHFDGTDGSTSLSDVTGKSYTLTGTGISLKTDQKKFGTASLSGFSGGRSLYVSGITFGPTEDFTVVAWARWGGSTSNHAVFTLPSAGIEILVSGGEICLWTATDGWSRCDPMPMNEWVLVAFERKDLQNTLTLNGVVQTSLTGPYINSSGVMNIGCYNNSSGSESFDGHIDEMLVRVGGTQFGGGAFTPPTEPFSV